MEMTGAQILLRMLAEESVDTLFGYPGGAVIDIYDELARSEIRHVLVRHEQAAVHAADGYARARGTVGVCLVTSGPGATNTVTGIASAYADSIPLVVLTGQVPTHLIGNDAFQEVDIVGITRPCTKHNYLVPSVDQLAPILKEAFHLARSGRPGPVLVDIPKNVQSARTLFRPPAPLRARPYAAVSEPHAGQLRTAARLIQTARRPLIFAGGGVIRAGAAPELTRLARRFRIPVTCSLMGLGAFPGDDPLFLGMLGMHGTYAANLSTGACDLLLGVGVRFDDRVTGKTDAFAPQATIVHIDIDPTSIRKNVPVRVPLVGDCRVSLERLNDLLDDPPADALEEARREWLARIEEWKTCRPLCYRTDGTIKPQQVVETLYELTRGEAIITTEVGQNQMWAAQYYRVRHPGHFISSGGLGTMGFGLPAAIGAQIACPEKTVVDIAGDGSIQMNIQELATAVQYRLPVKVVILNNGCLGMVRQWQELFYGGRYSATCNNAQPDFVKLAEAYGAFGLRAERPEEVLPVLERGLSLPGPAILDFRVTPEECVYPMVPAGAPITEMLLV